MSSRHSSRKGRYSEKSPTFSNRNPPRRLLYPTPVIRTISLHPTPLTPQQKVNRYVRAIRDRRVFSFDRRTPIGSPIRKAERINTDVLGKSLRTLQYAIPKRVAVCVRRKERREVLHALRVAGRSGSAFKPRRRTNSETRIKC